MAGNLPSLYPLLMAKSRLTRQDQISGKRSDRRLFLREWMLFVGKQRGKAISQVEVARAAGVGEAHISNVLNGRKGNSKQGGYGLDTDSLLGISDLFGVPVNALFRPPPPVTGKFATLPLDQPITLRQLIDLRDLWGKDEG